MKSLIPSSWQDKANDKYGRCYPDKISGSDKIPVFHSRTSHLFSYSKLPTCLFLSGQFTIDFRYRNQLQYSKVPN